MRRTGFREALVVLVAAAALAVAMTYPLAFGLGHLGRFETGDGRFSIWNVAWIAHALTTSPSHLPDANIFHPHTGTLFYAESNIGAGVLATPFYAITGNPYLAHNAVVLISFILSAVGMYYLARHLTGSRPAAAIAAILFAYCPFVYARTAHIQLLMTATLPFSMLAFHRVVERPRPARAAVLGLTLTATALTCGYYSVFVALLVGGAAVFYLVSRRYWANPAYYGALASAAGLGLVLTWPLLSHYVSLQHDDQPFRTLEESRLYSANFAAYLAAAGFGNGWLLRFAKNFSEVLFPGIVTLLLAAAGAWASIGLFASRGKPEAAAPVVARDHVVFYAAVAGVAFWLSFGPDAGLYTLGYRYAPLFTLMRAPARFGLVVTFALVVFAAVGAARWLPRRRGAWPLAIAVMLAALVELSPIPLNYREAEPPAAAYRALATLPDGAVAEFPFFYREGDFHRHTYYMLYSMFHWKPLVNGYSDFFPPDFLQMVIPVSSFPTLEAFGLLRTHDARYVIFHSDFYDHRSLAKLKDRIHQYREYLRPIVVNDNAWLYEIVAWPSVEPAQ
jgi:4-amino-4-deoxy-L-arabinose transferase-like glycosyltransferase